MKSSKKIIKIFGSKRSGTNYLEWLLKNNFEDLLVFTNQFQEKGGVPQELSGILGDNIGNKHERPTKLMYNICAGDPLSKKEKERLFSHSYFNKTNIAETEGIIAEGDVYFIFNTKNPFSWYESFCKFFEHKPSPINQTFIKEYSSVYKSYVDFSSRHPKKSLMVKYEDTLLDAEALIASVSKKFKFKRKNELVNPKVRLGPAQCATNQKFKKRDYFLNEEFMKNYSKEEISLVKSLISPAHRTLYFND